jgi:DNA-directed RNA polymerase specialized sigma24 family protein
LGDDGQRRPSALGPTVLRAIVHRTQRGDLSGPHELLDAITPYVQRLCGPNALQDAPDAVQETLFVVLRRIRDLREPAAIFGWV